MTKYATRKRDGICNAKAAYIQCWRIVDFYLKH